MTGNNQISGTDSSKSSQGLSSTGHFFTPPTARPRVTGEKEPLARKLKREGQSVASIARNLGEMRWP
jgi:hypothetical protein